MGKTSAIARALSRSERAQVKAAIKAGDELGYNRNYTRGLVKFGSEGMTPEARMARAREMGFDTPVYRGLTNFGGGGQGASELARKPGEPIWASLSPEHASFYANQFEGRGKGYDLLARTGNAWDYGKQEDIDRLWQSVTSAAEPGYETTLDQINSAVSHPRHNWENVEHISGDIRKAGFDGAKMTDSDGERSFPYYMLFDEKSVRSPRATFDPARANRRDLLAATIPATAALGAGALAMQPGEAEAAQPVASPALARALARQLEKDVGARRREAQGGLGYRIGQVATGLAQSAIEDPFAFIDPTMGFATAVRDDVKTDMDAARSRKTSETLRRAMLRSAPQVKRGAFSGRDTE